MKCAEQGNESRHQPQGGMRTGTEEWGESQDARKCIQSILRCYSVTSLHLEQRHRPPAAECPAFELSIRQSRSDERPISVIGTSSSSSTEAWLVQPEPDTWLALSASTTTTTTLGLGGASPAARERRDQRGQSRRRRLQLLQVLMKSWRELLQRLPLLQHLPEPRCEACGTEMVGSLSCLFSSTSTVMHLYRGCSAVSQGDLSGMDREVVEERVVAIDAVVASSNEGGVHGRCVGKLRAPLRS
ncbi:hypothetical protein F7725_027564 [Dissostichus mawsoni]|uniref:Uncharacterized protein n=1 Tax=Dissostichus mawsoni TaxID=36200 RepID=A0A7J5XD94_DISMA|nr:hypothetical protein F7725_027564 [Dissostichus mawsoni]